MNHVASSEAGELVTHRVNIMFTRFSGHLDTGAVEVDSMPSQADYS